MDFTQYLNINNKIANEVYLETVDLVLVKVC